MPLTTESNLFTRFEADGADLYSCVRGKRKRGYYPYTEEEDIELISIAEEAPRAKPESTTREYEDSIPWYQWRRPSFASPEQRSKVFRVPEESEPDSEDVFYDAPEKKDSKEKSVAPVVAKEAPVAAEEALAPIKTIDKDACQTCFGRKDVDVAAESRKFKVLAPLGTCERRINFAVETICDLVDVVNAGYDIFKQGNFYALHPSDP